MGTETWNTKDNLNYGDYFMWVHHAPRTKKHGTMWKWSCEAPEKGDKDWRFKEDGRAEFLYIRDAPSVAAGPARMATAENRATKEKFRLQLKPQTVGEEMKMSGGERGCAHSHLRLWKVAAKRSDPTLVLEDDAHLTFDRSAGKGKANGKLFTKRLSLALKHAPSDFDVIYLSCSGWRGGHHYHWKPYDEDPEAAKVIRKAEYVWTTVAYIISQAGAKK